MSKTLNIIFKAAITTSTMIAVNEVIGYHANPYKSATATRLACNVAGYTIGFAVGNKVSDIVLERIGNAIEAYHKEV